MDSHTLETIVVSFLMLVLAGVVKLIVAGAKAEIITEVKGQQSAMQSALDVHKAEDVLQFKRLDENDGRHEAALGRIEQRLSAGHGD